MNLALIIGALVLGIGAAHKREREASAGSDTRRDAAMRRVPERLRVQAQARARAGERPVSRPRRKLAQRPGVRSRKLPWLPDVVDEAILYAIEEGQTNPDAIRQFVLREVYPTTPDFQPIPWPAVPADGPAIHMLDERVKIRVECYLARLRDRAADEDYG